VRLPPPIRPLRFVLVNMGDSCHPVCQPFGLRIAFLADNVGVGGRSADASAPLVAPSAIIMNHYGGRTR
jgi:hypothetical protein